MFGLPNTQSQYVDDGKITTITSGLFADLNDDVKMDMADIVVRGEIVGKTTEVGYLDADRGIVKVFSVYEIEPTKFIKGEADGNLIVKVLGGETDLYRTISNYMPLENTNEVFMHLTLSDDETYYNVFSGVDTTYLVEQGVAKNVKNHYISEQQILDDYDKLVKKVELSNEK